MTLARADLHVHSRHSTVNGTLPFLRSRDCYSAPLDVYRTAKRRGMTIVTITDHDSIDGCLELLARLPDASDVIVGEEVSCRLPGADCDVHIAAYGMTESLHREIQALRGNVFEVVAGLREADVFFALNHPFHFYRGQIPLASYLRLVFDVPAVEVRNGSMLRAHNELIERLCRDHNGPRPATIGGSDAHTLRRVGRTWTEAPGASATAFLESLRRGLGRVGGSHGGVGAVAGDTYGVVARYAASVFGWGPRDHAGWHRLACAACLAGSVPAQWVPALTACLVKLRERRSVKAAADAFQSSSVPAFEPAPAEPKP